MQYDTLIATHECPSTVYCDSDAFFIGHAAHHPLVSDYRSNNNFSSYNDICFDAA